MKNKNVVGSVLLLSAIALSACDDDDNDKKLDQTIDPTVLNNPLDNSEFIDKKIEKFLADFQIPGMSIAVVSGIDEKKNWSNAYGVTNLDTQKPVTTDTSFWLGSLSKHVTGLSMMIAHDQGLINLEDDIRPLVESQAGFTIDNLETRPITYRQLMSHTSGIIDSDAYECAYFVNAENGEQNFLLNLFEDEEICPPEGPTTLRGYLEEYLNEDGVYYSVDDNFLDYEPGTYFEYTNIGTGLAGYSLELAAGQTLADFAQTNIFTPLSMSNTSWERQRLNAENIATPYTFDDEEERAVALPIYELTTWPDGGLRGSVNDISRLMSTLMNGGKISTDGGQLVESQSLAEMQSATSGSYGLFTEIYNNFEYGGESHNLFGHTGSDPGAFSFMLFNKENSHGIVILSNGDDESIDEDLIGDALKDLIVTLFEAGELMSQ